MHAALGCRGACPVRWSAERAASRALPAPAALGRRPTAHNWAQQTRCGSGNPDTPAYKSFDSEDELDASLTDEFAKLTNPKRMQQAAAHLDLAWKIGKSRKRLVCETCTGSGEGECHWCHGTGFLTVGDSLFCSTSGNCDCPVCKGKGYLKCDKCRGTGHRAGWLDQQGFSP